MHVRARAWGTTRAVGRFYLIEAPVAPRPMLHRRRDRLACVAYDLTDFVDRVKECKSNELASRPARPGSPSGG